MATQPILKSPTSSAQFVVQMMYEGSRGGDLVLGVINMAPDLSEAPVFVDLRPPFFGGGNCPKTYDAMKALMDVLAGNEPARKKSSIPKKEEGKAIMVDGDGEDRLFSLEGTTDRWILHSFSLTYKGGAKAEFRKSELSPDQNRALANLLGAMSQEQGLAAAQFEQVMTLHRNVEEASHTSELPEYAEAWQRYLLMQEELKQLAAGQRR